MGARIATWAKSRSNTNTFRGEFIQADGWVMANEVSCPEVHSLQVKDEFAGKQGKYPHFGEKVTAPIASQATQQKPAIETPQTSVVFRPAVASAPIEPPTHRTSKQADTCAQEVPDAGGSSARKQDAKLKMLGRFEIKDVLSQEAFGKVYRAYDPQLDREVALKVPRAGTLVESKNVERFLREARSAAQLRHPNIVPVFEIGQVEDVYYIAAGYIAGQTLSGVLKSRKRYSHEETAVWVSKLAAVHRTMEDMDYVR